MTNYKVSAVNSDAIGLLGLLGLLSIFQVNKWKDNKIIEIRRIYDVPSYKGMPQITSLSKAINFVYTEFISCTFLSDLFLFKN